MVLSYKMFESYKDYNKNLDYVVTDYLSSERLEEVTYKYLNQYFTGWVIFENSSLEDFIVHVINWKTISLFTYDGYYIKNQYTKAHRDYDHNFSHLKTNLYKVDIKGIKGRRFDESDPYGEEHWYD
jgi:hypothetical protein